MTATRTVVIVAASALFLGTLPSLLRTSEASETKKGKATPTPKAAVATPTPAPATPAPKAAEPAPAPAAATEPAPLMKPDDLAGLKEKLGTVVTVEGVPVRAAETKTQSVRFLDFANGVGKAITVVFIAGKGEPVTLEEVQGYIGKSIRVTGPVTEYSGKLQIAIEKKAQIVEVMP